MRQVSAIVRGVWPHSLENRMRFGRKVLAWALVLCINPVCAEVARDNPEKLSAGVSKDLKAALDSLSMPAAQDVASPDGGLDPTRDRRFLITVHGEDDVTALLESLKDHVSGSGVYFGKIVYADTKNSVPLLTVLRSNPKVAFVEEWSDLGRPPIQSPPTIPFNIN